MTRLPDLRDELIRAAARQDRRRGRFGWRPFAVGAVAALGVSGAAFAATGSQVPVLSALVRPGADGAPTAPRNAAAARRLALDRDVTDLINKADLEVFAARPRCRPTVVDDDGAGRVTEATPSRSVLRLVAALRRAPTAAERRLAREPRLRQLGEATFVKYVRRLTAADGTRFTVVVARSARDIFRPRPGCLDAQHDRLAALVADRDTRLRHAALASFASMRHGQENNLRVSRRPRDTVSLLDSGGGGWTPADVRAGRAFVAGNAFGEPVRLTGLVPDGVATVTVSSPRRVEQGRDFAPHRYRSAFRRRVRVNDNVVRLVVPRSPGDALKARLIWRDARGRLVRVVNGPG